MRLFVQKIILLCIPLFISLFLCGFLANGYTDTSYIKFTTPKQKNLIIGTSRAAIGIQPSILSKILNKDFFNYSFTITQSPFGKIYFNSIKKKHLKHKDGTYIVTIDPWSICTWNDHPENPADFRENATCLSNTKNVNTYPNYRYLYNNLKGNYFKILLPNTNSWFFIHDDGWLEVQEEYKSPNNKATMVNKTIDFYKENHFVKTKFSTNRLHYLLETIKYLKKYGNVYLIRLPVHKKMTELEQQLMPDFNLKVKKAIEMSNAFLDLTDYSDSLQFYDSDHLTKKSSEQISTLIAKWIEKEENKK